MAERPKQGKLSHRLDRVSRPDPTRPLAGDGRYGRHALYSTAPGAPPSAHVLVTCDRCGVQSGLIGLRVAQLLRPPFLLDPFGCRLWTRCPACRRRAWLDLAQGQALRALLDR